MADSKAGNAGMARRGRPRKDGAKTDTNEAQAKEIPMVSKGKGVVVEQPLVISPGEIPVADPKLVTGIDLPNLKSAVLSPSIPSSSSNVKNSWADDCDKLAGNQNGKSYAEAAKGNRDTQRGWALKYVPVPIGSTSVVITDDEIKAGREAWSTTLVATVLGKRLLYSDVKYFVETQWRLVDMPRINIRANGVCLFSFNSAEDMNAVLERRWTFFGFPMILRPWTPDLDLNKPDFSRIPVWVRFPDLSLEYWTPEILGKLASYLGRPIATDSLTAARQRLGYARVLVDVEIFDTLPESVPLETSFGKARQPVSFEWLPVQCSRCKRYGHQKIHCRVPEQKMWVEKSTTDKEVVVPEVIVSATEILTPPVPVVVTAPQQQHGGESSSSKFTPAKGNFSGKANKQQINQKQEKSKQLNKYSLLTDQTTEQITLPQNGKPAIAVNFTTNDNSGKKKVPNGDKQSSQLAGGGKTVFKK